MILNKEDENEIKDIQYRIQKAEKNGYTGIVIDCIDVDDLNLNVIKTIFDVKEMADDDTHYYIISNHALKLN